MRSLLIVLCLTSIASAELTPEQVAVLAVESSPESLEIARYYLQVRKIPESHLLLLKGPFPTVLSRRDWDEQVAPQIRQLLDDQEFGPQIRCLVTTWGVPLKIAPLERAVAVQQRHVTTLSSVRAERINALREMLTKLGQIAADEPESQESVPADAAPLREWATTFQVALRSAQERIAKTEEGTEERQLQERRLEELLVAGGGRGALLRARAASAEPDPAEPSQDARVAELRGEFQGLRAGLAALQHLPESLPRDLQILDLVAKSDGLLGSIQWLDQYLPLLQGRETYASFDSELSLLYWPEVPLIRWWPNPLHHSWDKQQLADERRTLMVARLEAPSVEIVKRLLDAGIATEQSGLTGKCYIDSRGIAFEPGRGQRGSYGDYDDALRQLAGFLKAHTSIEVVHDDRPELFPPDSCPEAALYCGWYSLSKYIDSFGWQPGAVAYHIASGEAATLRDAASQVWCKRMLEEGVAATTGPVYEPYLAAFPRPDEFFPLLLTGRLTLAETYFRTLPFSSWVMVLVGDPLYNPYGLHPAWVADQIPEQVQRLLPRED